MLVDVDPGIHRTGVASAVDAVTLARQIADAQQLMYGGVQFYCGSQQHIPIFADRRAAIADRTAYLRTVIAALAEAGLPPPVVTGGGTGTHRIDVEFGVLTELQVGSYIFMDREYRDCDLGTTFATALMVDTRVISANAPGMATLDAGLKAFATEAGMPVILAGAPRGQHLSLHGRRTRRGDTPQRCCGTGSQRAHHGHHPALRPDRKPLRRLSRRQRRHFSRDLANNGPRPFGPKKLI
ncbi:hypothetical protein FPZ24_00050 [Sphingomonas panacisoli]|uniref:Uncharacterized protein n=1 Tax=Sphingomonas panacisoli TaxID=1813879 RepID=A0A5B8LD58_9SPHN|nr:alanine racemase [Sphingomonas panacisoli]QDZ06061.1 hypothetical protein FPZ24_00050 [Sphingomonas panacisoli]